MKNPREQKETLHLRRETLHLRRQLIFRHVVLDNRPLQLAQLRIYLKGLKYDEATAHQDVEAFASVGCKLKVQECATVPGEKEIVFTEGPHTDDDTVRENLNLAEKQLVARLGVSLICGVQYDAEQSDLPPWMQDTSAQAALKSMFERTKTDKETIAAIKKVLAQASRGKHAEGRGFPLATAREILRMLGRTNALLKHQHEFLKRAFYTFWAETSRFVAIDSGTTNIHLARYLQKVHLPLLGTPQCSLTVCTNSRRIFEVLGPSGVWVKSIIVGGQQLFRTPTIAGSMAEAFMRSASILQFGMCLLGATRVDLDRLEVCSDSQEESSIKNLLMERSSLRVICIDSSKLQIGPGRTGYRFAAIDPKHIDLFLTNCPFAKKSEAAVEDYKEFIEKVQMIEDRGVPVLVATSPDTFQYPSVPQKPLTKKKILKDKAIQLPPAREMVPAGESMDSTADA